MAQEQAGQQTEQQEDENVERKQVEQQQQEPPGTPENIHKIPRDESFKTCKTDRFTPNTKRQLRATPARTSILSGGKPFKESTLSKKFNSRKKATTNSANKRQLNESCGSNETFIRKEQELMFDRDSLDIGMTSTLDLEPSTVERYRKSKQLPDIKSPIKQQPSLEERSEEEEERSVRKSSSVKKSPSPQKKPHKSPRKSPRKASPIKSQKKRSPRKQPTQQNKVAQVLPQKQPFIRAGFQQKQQQLRQQHQFTLPKLPRPQQQELQRKFQPPASVMRASSTRCISLWDSARKTRSNSFKSTAELEREYFNSLRSRF